MKKVIAMTALILVSGSCFAGSFFDNNVDLNGWVVTNTPKSSDTDHTTTTIANAFSSNNDLYGWIVNSEPTSQDQTATSAKQSVAYKPRNNDLYGWIVSEVQHHG